MSGIDIIQEEKREGQLIYLDGLDPETRDAVLLFLSPVLYLTGKKIMNYAFGLLRVMNRRGLILDESVHLNPTKTGFIITIRVDVKGFHRDYVEVAKEYHRKLEKLKRKSSNRVAEDILKLFEKLAIGDVYVQAVTRVSRLNARINSSTGTTEETRGESTETRSDSGGIDISGDNEDTGGGGVE